MPRKILILIAAVLSLLLVTAPTVVAEEPEEESIEEILERLKELEDRMQKPERHAGADRMDWSGDYRFEAHSISADIPEHFDGLALQGLVVDTLFYAGATGGMFPTPSPGQTTRDFLNGFINQDADTWVAYQQYLAGLTFDQLVQAVGSFSPAQQQALFGLIQPETFRPASDADNSILYTNRLRLRFQAQVGSKVRFDGRLSAYKVFGDSTGVQVFNGQPNTIGFDGSTVGVPNSDIIRVERAYFNWTDIADTDLYLSIGRRPSTGGAPLNFRQDEPRGGTPLGAVVDYQFDGITLGYHLTPVSTLRLCYGVGYESGFGNGLQAVNALDDAQFLGLNWDILNTDRMFIQTTVARAMDVTDGFNGLVVLPVDPLTGQSAPAPAVLRFSPTANVGDVDLASLVLIRHDGPFDWFLSANYSESDPVPVTTPFGGLFSDPFETPTAQDGTMYWGGIRYRFNDERTKVGLEFNHGSQYWFNFALAQDDLIGAKTSTRGDVWEAYVTHRIDDRFVVKFDYIDYSYDYSGSGWILGAPHDLDSSPPPTLGFPTYDKAQKASFSLIARW
jgi:hypothetical protein